MGGSAGDELLDSFRQLRLVETSCRFGFDQPCLGMLRVETEEVRFAREVGPRDGICSRGYGGLGMDGPFGLPMGDCWSRQPNPRTVGRPRSNSDWFGSPTWTAVNPMSPTWCAQPQIPDPAGSCSASCTTRSAYKPPLSRPRSQRAGALSLSELEQLMNMPQQAGPPRIIITRQDLTARALFSLFIRELAGMAEE